MAVIQKVLKLLGSKGSADVPALFDGGSSYSCIAEDLANQLAMVQPLFQPMEFETAQKGHKVQVTNGVFLEFRINDYRFFESFFVVPNLAQRLIIGADTMQKFRFKLDYEAEDVILDPRTQRLRI